VAVAVWSTWQRWQVLDSSPFPLGVDGYFYPVQLRALLDHGSLRYPAAPLAFWLMAPVAWLTDPITGAKLGAALGGALIAVPMYGIGRRVGGVGAGLVAAVVATTSAGSAYLSIEFVKNGIGLTVAMVAVWAVLVALEAWTPRRAAVAAAAIVAAALTHKMAAGLVVVLCAPAAIGEARRRGVTLRRLGVLAAGAAALAVVVGIAWPQRFVSAVDLGDVAGAISATAHWDLPALARPHLTIGYEPLLGAAVAAVTLVAILATRSVPLSPVARALAIAAAALALVIAIPWLAVDDAQGLAMRLRVAAFIPLAITAAVAGRAAVAGLAERTRDPALAAIAAGIALAVAIIFPAGRGEGEVITHPALASAVMSLDGLVPDDDVVVVPERHIAFMVAWYTGADVSLRPDVVPRARRRRLLPLAFIGDKSALDQALLDARKEPLLDPPIGLHARHPDGLVLVTESTWEWVLARLPDRARRHFAAWPTI
jgi:hypothetical protein